MELSLKHLRLVKDKTQEDLAKALGVHIQTYRKYEENPEELTIKQAKALSKILQVPYDDIFFAH